MYFNTHKPETIKWLSADQWQNTLSWYQSLCALCGHVYIPLFSQYCYCNKYITDITKTAAVIFSLTSSLSCFFFIILPFLFFSVFVCYMEKKLNYLLLSQENNRKCFSHFCVFKNKFLGCCLGTPKGKNSSKSLIRFFSHWNSEKTAISPAILRSVYIGYNFRIGREPVM